MTTTKTRDERVTALTHNLRITADLIGPDPENAHPEYLRALSEQACLASSISTNHKDAVSELAVSFAQTTDPDRSIAAFAQDVEASTDLIGPDISVDGLVNPEYIRALTEHACFVANLSGNNAEAVHAVFVGILTDD